MPLNGESIVNTKNGHMTQAQLARELDLSECMVSKLKKRGMPTHSVADAQAWRAFNLDPILVKAIRRPGVVAQYRTPGVVAQANELGELAGQAIAAGAWRDFVRHVEELRAVLSTLSDAQEARVRLPIEIWDALCGRAGPWSDHVREARTNEH